MRAMLFSQRRETVMARWLTSVAASDSKPLTDMARLELPDERVADSKSQSNITSSMLKSFALAHISRTLPQASRD